MIISKVYKGTTEFSKGYKGSQLIFSSGRLPSQYQEVEWIKSTSNTQFNNYINTGFIPSEYTTVTATLKVGTDFNDFGRLFGADDSGFCILNYGDYNNWHMRVARGEFTYTDIQPDTIYEVSLGWDGEDSTNGRFMLNGNVIETYGWGGYNFTHPLLIFSSWADRDGAYTLYSFKVEDNGVLVRDYVPCYIKATNEVGLYDLITKEFYHNLGSVPFLKGGDV